MMTGNVAEWVVGVFGVLRGGGCRVGGRRCFCAAAVALLFAAAWPAAAQWLSAMPGGVAAPVVTPQILRTVRHDTAAFTQGLLFYDTLLYESTGLVGRSSLRRVDPRGGGELSSIAVGGGRFAEGIAVLGGELVQLTWKDRVALRYEFPSLRGGAFASFRYRGEGWGLASDSTRFIMSNGSDTLYFRDAGFEVTRALPVTLNGKPLAYLNELECVRGRVYANVWYKNFIVEIRLESGAVSRVIDCSELVGIERPLAVDHVLNGIAYDGRRDEWYLTGKNWRNIFVVKIPKPEL